MDCVATRLESLIKKDLELGGMKNHEGYFPHSRTLFYYYFIMK